MILCGISIVGIPMGWIYAIRWLFRNISLSNGTQVSFKGTARQMYGFFVLSAVLSILGRYDPTASEPFSQATPLLVLAFALVWSFALLATEALVQRALYKFVCANVVLSSGTRLTFRGRAWPYVWWTLLSLVSLFTIVGWAWVGTAFFRWQLKNTDAGNYHLTFRGKGVSLLWRAVCGLIASIAILSIPWVVAWLARWAVENLEAKRISSPAAVSDRIAGREPIRHPNRTASPQELSSPRTVQCWKCKIPIEVTPKIRGKQVRCPSCHTKQIMPM